MARPRPQSLPIPTLERDDLLYLAGIFDGEGCCMIAKARKHAGARSGYAYSPSWKIVLTHEETISFLASKLGRPYAHIKARVDRNWKDSYRLLISDTSGVLAILQQLLPHLHVKREPALVLARFCESRLQKPTEQYHKPYSPEEIAMHLSLRTLNMKGVRALGQVPN